MAVSRQKSFELEGNPDELFESMVRALSDMRCHRFSRDGTTIVARTPISWLGLGEVVTVRLSDAGAGMTRVEAASHTALRTVIFDWGKNNDNLRRFEAAFRQRIAEQARGK